MRKFNSLPTEMFLSLWRNRWLVRSLTVREVIGRYRGSFAGIVWSLFNPLLMLIVYTAVFSGIFKLRWGTIATETRADFAIILFVGLIVHGLFAECVNRAPLLILSNVNFVKKVIFPLEILPWVALGSALFHAAVSLFVLIAAMLVTGLSIPWTTLYFPLIMLPLIFATMGFAWLLAALGVFLRDISQLTGIATTVLLFLSPVFFPLSNVPEGWRPWFQLNPLTNVIEESRNALIYGRAPDLSQLSSTMLAGLAIAWLGFVVFQKIRRGFADVL